MQFAPLLLVLLPAVYILVVLLMANFASGPTGAERVLSALDLNAAGDTRPDPGEVTQMLLVAGDGLDVELEITVSGEGMLELRVPEQFGAIMVPSNCELQMTPQGWSSPDCELGG